MQKGVNKKFKEVGYQFNSALSLLTDTDEIERIEHSKRLQGVS